MEEPRNIFIIPLIAGIMVVISVLTPATFMAYSGKKDFLWLWGFYMLDDPILDIHIGGFMVEIIHPSYICSILIGTGGIILIIYAIKLRLGRKEFKNMRDISIFASLLIIAGEILWLVFIPLLFPTEEFLGHVLPGEILSFWRFYYVGSTPLHYIGFGIIGGFIAAGLSFISVGVTHRHSKEELITIPEKVKVPEKIPEAEKPILYPKALPPITSADFNYCPECGTKKVLNANFCTECGRQFI
ncbi:MAG: zinc ribbon domain-containing protein [Candidatus Hermodarchaeota archaeon]